ncbi:MAG: sigma-70 family RNA polymerase sigma factor [Ferruginibacter sp.]|nr:sigma-70 family RNA polymerase sigma factor [Ferruginibacter sp.]
MKNTVIYTEDSLIFALHKHDNDAYEYLYTNYKSALYAVIQQFILDQEIANDVLQEVFVTAWKNIEKYDHTKGRLFTWLHTLTRNTAINTLRSKNYKRLQKNDVFEDFVYDKDLKESTEQNINAIGLRKQVHLLREDYKNVLELSYFNGFTHEEIAKILDIPIGTVKTRLRNALIELRKKFV